MNFEAFIDTLPIIGQCLLGVFGSIAFIIFVIFLLNKGAELFENAKNEKNNDE